jgi:CRISPR/Cas system-associated endonuclease Cas1
MYRRRKNPGPVKFIAKYGVTIVALAAAGFFCYKYYTTKTERDAALAAYNQIQTSKGSSS